MKKIVVSCVCCIVLMHPLSLCAQQRTEIRYVDSFANKQHPQIAYWFLTPAILSDHRYLSYFTDMMDHSLFDFIFLDAREGCSFDSIKQMHEVVQDIVSLAHKRNVRIGMRMHPSPLKPLPVEITERFIAEGETHLDAEGTGLISMNAGFVRTGKSFKKEIYKVYLFKKTADGFYEPGTLQETTQYTVNTSKDTLTVLLKGGSSLAGYTAYALSQFYFNIITNHSAEVINQTYHFIDAYKDIPLDGIMLDEYSNPRLTPSWLVPENSVGLRLRSYSLPLAKEMETRTSEPAAATLFNMRYAPNGKPMVRIKAINTYMDLVREGAMHVENAMYQKAKEVFGQKCFIGAHNTFHNSLINDDIWATGIKWWSIPREYGFTDEKTPLPTQLGIAMSYPNRAMYNMYYDKSIDSFVEKTLHDLRYGIRTFYHAFNDTHWGIGLEQPVAYSSITPVEKCARLMNQFNPSLPEDKLLVIFGNEALQNWYPNLHDRGKYDINDKLDIEEKTLQILHAGYMNALVPSDLINEGKLKLNAHNMPELNGHVFDAVIFLYPQYAKEKVLSFLEKYVNAGGKLMLEGSATYDFSAHNITTRMEALRNKAIVTSFSIDQIPRLGVLKNTIPSGCVNEDGSYVFTDLNSLKNGLTVSFTVTKKQHTYVGKYRGLAAIQLDKNGNLLKLAAGNFSSLTDNGKEILHVSKESDLLLVNKQGLWDVQMADRSKTVNIK